jgi:hypothetical protein
MPHLKARYRKTEDERREIEMAQAVGKALAQKQGAGEVAEIETDSVTVKRSDAFNQLAKPSGKSFRKTFLARAQGLRGFTMAREK